MINEEDENQILRVLTFSWICQMYFFHAIVKSEAHVCTDQVQLDPHPNYTNSV